MADRIEKVEQKSTDNSSKENALNSSTETNAIIRNAEEAQRKGAAAGLPTLELNDNEPKSSSDSKPKESRGSKSITSEDHFDHMGEYDELMNQIYDIGAKKGIIDSSNRGTTVDGFTYGDRRMTPCQVEALRDSGLLNQEQMEAAQYSLDLERNNDELLDWENPGRWSSDNSTNEEAWRDLAAGDKWRGGHQVPEPNPEELAAEIKDQQGDRSDCADEALRRAGINATPRRDGADSVVESEPVETSSPAKYESELGRRLGVAYAADHGAYDINTAATGDKQYGASLDELKKAREEGNLTAEQKDLVDFYINNFDDLDAALDGTKDGRITGADGQYATDLGAFRADAVKVIRAEHSAEFLDKHFQAIDDDGNGHLDLNELGDGFAEVPAEDRNDVLHASSYVMNKMYQGIRPERVEGDGPNGYVAGVSQKMLDDHADSVKLRENGELIDKLMQQLNHLRTR